jgi:hypothetical protein
VVGKTILEDVGAEILRVFGGYLRRGTFHINVKEE